MSITRRTRRAAVARARRAQWTPLERVWGAEHHPDAPPGLARAYRNAVYSVQVYRHDTEWGVVDHLMVRRHDDTPVRSWADMQRIKNEVAGAGRTAIEVFPPDAELVDQANMYHLWILPEGFRLPFGLGDMWRATRLGAVGVGSHAST